jgi:hypothetical protein
MVVFPDPSEIRSWLTPYALVGGLWLVVAAGQGYWAWAYREHRGRRILFVVGVLGATTVAAVFFGRDVRAAARFPFDPDAVESVTVEEVVEFVPRARYRVPAGPEVSDGLRLLARSERTGGKDPFRAEGPRVYYRVTIRLAGEAAAARYVDAYPDTQLGGPCVGPGFFDSRATLGLYRSDAFVRWVAEVMDAARTQAGEPPPEGGIDSAP